MANTQVAISEVAPQPLVGPRLGQVSALDGVRACAILLVFLIHFRYNADGGALDRWVNEAFQGGWIGVDLFFVLSGFLITGVLWEARGSPHYFRNFYARRALRLSPVYFGVLIVLFILLPRIHPTATLRGLQPYQAWYWTYTVNILQCLRPAIRDVRANLYTAHFWSLSVEEQFYLVWPFVVLWCTPKTMLRLGVLAILVAFVYRSLVVAYHLDIWFAFALVPGRMDALALGAILCVASRDSRGSQLIRKHWKHVGLLALGLMLLMGSWLGNFRFWTPGLAPSGYLLTDVACAAFLGGLLAAPSTPLFRPLHGRLLQQLGKISYGAYIYHHLLIQPLLPVRHWFQERAPRFGSYLPWELAWMVLIGSISVALAAASYRWYELPILRLKRRFGSTRAQ